MLKNNDVFSKRENSDSLEASHSSRNEFASMVNKLPLNWVTAKEMNSSSPTHNHHHVRVNSVRAAF